MGAAAIGAGTYVGGNALDAYGQNQGVKAMQRVWAEAQARQAGLDAQLQERAKQLIAGSGVAANANAAGEQQLRNDLDSTTINAAKGAVEAAARHQGTPNAGKVTAGYQATLADALRRAAATAKLGAFNQGANRVDILGRQFATDRADLGQRSREWASLLPWMQQVAGMQGGMARGVGQTFQMAGRGLMSYGMSQPRGGGGAQSQGEPVGGWADPVVNPDEAYT